MFSKILNFLTSKLADLVEAIIAQLSEPDILLVPVVITKLNFGLPSRCKAIQYCKFNK